MKNMIKIIRDENPSMSKVITNQYDRQQQQKYAWTHGKTVHTP